MPAIKGAREELDRLKLRLANLEIDGPPSSEDAAKHRIRLEMQMLRLEKAIFAYDRQPS